MIVHPLYVELQKKSPLGKFDRKKPAYNITEVDFEQMPMGKHEFYSKHLSKSLPAIFRNEAKYWDIFQNIQTPDWL